MSSIVGTPGDDPLVGTSLADTILGFEGRDTINGGGGNDTIFGNEGDDVLEGGTGTDLLLGGDGNDLFIARSSDTGHDDYTGGNGFDTLVAVSSSSIGSSFTVSIGDVIMTERFVNNSATQTVNISANGSTRLDSITEIASVGGGIGSIIGSSGDDFISSFDMVLNPSTGFLEGWSDVINAGAGNDTVFGNAGNDQINGGSGNDTLTGGSGDDDLTGGTGADVFRFNGGMSFGVDLVLDFTDGDDKIEVFNGNQVGSAGLLDLGTSGVAITLDSDAIILLGFDIADLDRTDFVDPNADFLDQIFLA